MKVKPFIALALYILALVPRLWGISAPAPEPDEVHWLNRSGGVIEQFQQQKYSALTTHLGHPGVPAGCIMALGQLASEAYNNYRGLNKKDPRFVDRLTGSRIANATFSALIVPLLFLGCEGVFGVAVALLAALLLCFDPRLLGLSRIAHIDAVLSIFVLLALGYYFAAVTRARVVLKLVAGAFWGLAIATKPTAMAMIPTFLLFKLILGKTDRTGTLVKEPAIAWSDAWAIVVGHLVFALIYTRLWPHDSDYLHRLAVRSSFADLIYCSPMLARAFEPFFSIGVGFVAVVFFRAAWKLTRKGGRAATASGYWQTQLLGSALLLAVLLYPAVCENIVRFWCWVAGLSEVKHAAYNRTLPPPPGGYLGLLFVRLPSVAIVCFVVGLMALVLRFRQLLLEAKSARQGAMLLLAAVSLVCWVGLLSVSSKQTIRYLVPALPGVYLLAAFGVAVVMRRLTAQKSLQLLCGGVVVLLQAVASYRIHPAYELFFSDISGGLKGAAARGHPLPLADPSELLDTLLAQAALRKQSFSVGVLGDIESIRMEAKRRFVGDRLVFHPELGPQVTDFVLASGWRLTEHLAQPEHSVLNGVAPIQETRVEGVIVAALYELPRPRYDESYIFPMVGFHHPAGRDVIAEGASIVRDHSRRANGRTVIAGIPGVDGKGFLLSGYGVRVPQGQFELTVDVAVPDLTTFTDRVPERLVLRLEFGKTCERVVALRELAVGQTTRIALRCSFDQLKRPQVTAYWFGSIPVLIDNVRLVRVP